MNFHWEEVPFVRLLVPLIGGILCAIALGEITNHTSLLFPLLLFCFTLFIIHVFKLTANIYRLRWLNGLLIALSVFCLGYELTIQHNEIQKDTHFSHHWTNEAFVYVKIEEPPIEKAKSYKALSSVLRIEDSTKQVNTTGKVIVYLAKDSALTNLRYGDVLLVKAKFNAITPNKNPHEFDYRTYLQYQNIYHQAYFRAIDWQVVDYQPSDLYQIIYTTRSYLLKVIQDKVGGTNEAAVASALLLGYKQLLEDDLVKTYSTTGAMHVLAVSGLHVGIILVILRWILQFVTNQVLKTIIILGVIWLFAFITGLPPSVCRASVMFSFVAIGQSMNRRTNIYNILAASAFFILCFDPYMIMQVGFRLSYAAVVGIVFLQPQIYRWFLVKNWLLDKIWQITAVSIAAQLATAPISFFYFQQFPTYFFISNLIVIPAATLILGLGIALFAFSFVPFINILLGKLLYYCIALQNWLLASFKYIPLSHIEGISISVTGVWLLYAFILLFVFFFMQKEIRYLKLALFAILLIAGGLLARQIQQHHQKQLTVYAIKNGTAIEFVEGKRSLLLVDSILVKNEHYVPFHIQPNQEYLGINDKKTYALSHFNTSFKDSLMSNNLYNANPFLRFYDKTLLLLHKNINPYRLNTNAKVDYVLLTQNSKVDLCNLTQIIDFKELIIAPSNKKWRSKRWLAQCEELNLNCYDVYERGAFVYQW